MATFEVYRTARTTKRCENYPSCDQGIQPGERYLRASATPHDGEVNQGDRWWTLNICCRCMRPEVSEVRLCECRGVVPDCSDCHGTAQAVSS